MESFEFESGRVLEDVNVEFAVSGIPKYDEDGNITNAIIFCPTIKGGNSTLVHYHEIIYENNFDKDEYFFIRIFSLGSPGSCSPSSTGLKYDFPSYTVKDRVNFKRQFLKQKFNLTNVLGLIGEGLGGCEILTWASEYPDDMEFIAIVNPSFKLSGYRYVFVKSIESIIDSSEDFYSDHYNPSLSKLAVAINRLLFSGYFSKNTIMNMTNDEIDVLMDDFVDEGLFMDIHDFKSRNDCILRYDIEDKISNIKAKSLIIGISGYLFINIEKDILPFSDLIKDSKVCIFKSKDNYHDSDKYSEVGQEIVSFVKQF